EAPRARAQPHTDSAIAFTNPHTTAPAVSPINAAPHFLIPFLIPDVAFPPQDFGRSIGRHIKIVRCRRLRLLFVQKCSNPRACKGNCGYGCKAKCGRGWS